MNQPAEETEKLLSMEKSLELLAKKTKSESEALFRTKLSNLNTLAGIKMVQKKVTSKRKFNTQFILKSAIINYLIFLV
jgi:hypothetical protein